MVKKRILDVMWALTHPTHWVRISRASGEWDSLINSLIEKDSFEGVGEFLAYTDSIQIWVNNFPYCFGHNCWNNRFSKEALPYRRTVAKLHKHLKEKFGDEYTKHDRN